MSLFRFLILELHLSFESVPHCAATISTSSNKTVYTFSRSSVHWQLDLSPLGHWSWQGLTPESAWNGSATFESLQTASTNGACQKMNGSNTLCVRYWTYKPLHRKKLQVWCSNTSTQLTVHAECGAVAPHIEARCLRQSHLARPHHIIHQDTALSAFPWHLITA